MEKNRLNWRKNVLISGLRTAVLIGTLLSVLIYSTVLIDGTVDADHLIGEQTIERTNQQIVEQAIERIVEQTAERTDLRTWFAPIESITFDVIFLQQQLTLREDLVRRSEEYLRGNAWDTQSRHTILSGWLALGFSDSDPFVNMVRNYESTVQVPQFPHINSKETAEVSASLDYVQNTLVNLDPECQDDPVQQAISFVETVKMMEVPTSTDQAIFASVPAAVENPAVYRVVASWRSLSEYCDYLNRQNSSSSHGIPSGYTGLVASVYNINSQQTETRSEVGLADELSVRQNKSPVLPHFIVGKAGFAAIVHTVILRE